MPIWGWFFVAAVVIAAVVALVVANAASRRKRTEGLKQRFGPEYDRTLSEAGEQKVAEKELAARERKRRKLNIRPLTPAALDGYSHRWRAVQTAFVDDPAGALGDADELVTEVMRERGYPVDDFDQQADDVSVDHPTVVANYRAGHAIYSSQRSGEIGTEQQRQAFVHYRALFDQLLESDTDTTPSRHTGTDTAQEATA